MKNIILRIRDIIFKIKDYDRLESDYVKLLSDVTNNTLSRSNYDINAVLALVHDEQKKLHEDYIKSDLTEMIEADDMESIKDYVKGLISF